MNHKLTIATLLVAVALAGCQTKPSTPDAPIDDKSAAGAAGAGAGGTTTSGTAGSGVGGQSVPSTTVGAAGSGAGGDPLKDPNNILSKRSVFFEYDSFAVSEQYRPLVEAHARYLMGNSNAKATVQGHTDERGSREYNIALGQRRADSVKRMMVLVGVRDMQVETVSFGEERPRAAGHDESSYADNRRGDILYAGE